MKLYLKNIQQYHTCAFSLSLSPSNISICTNVAQSGIRTHISLRLFPLMPQWWASKLKTSPVPFMHTVAVLKHSSLHLYIIAIYCKECLMCSKRVCFLVISVNQEKAYWEQKEFCEIRALPEASQKLLLWCWKLPVQPLQKGCTRDCRNGSFYT